MKGRLDPLKRLLDLGKTCANGGLLVCFQDMFLRFFPHSFNHIIFKFLFFGPSSFCPSSPPPILLCQAIITCCLTPPSREVAYNLMVLEWAMVCIEMVMVGIFLLLFDLWCSEVTWENIVLCSSESWSHCPVGEAGSPTSWPLWSWTACLLVENTQGD